MTRFSKLSLAGVLAVLPIVAPQAQFPTTPPAPMPLGDAQFPPFVEFELANGLRVLVVSSQKQPVLSLTLDLHGVDASLGTPVVRGREPSAVRLVVGHAPAAPASEFVGTIDHQVTRGCPPAASGHDVDARHPRVAVTRATHAGHRVRREQDRVCEPFDLGIEQSLQGLVIRTVDM
jgi:hypothetical protein